MFGQHSVWRGRRERAACGSPLATRGSYNPGFTMRVFMQTRPAGADAPRFYQLVLQQDLLGGWTLFREWGQQGSRSSSRRELYLERDAALSAFERARDAQLKRGFQVMFSQGFEGPHAG
jgi:predicted DNA-binding WGR domain protein